jgi:DNA polymerase III subunit beta
MQFTGNRNDLAEAITHAANGIPVNPVVPVYAGMCVQAAGDTVYFIGSDGDSTFTSLSACKVDKGGVLSLPGKLLSEIVKSFPDNDITFSSPESGTSGATVTITCGRSTFQLQSYKDPYPGVPKDCDLKGSIPADDFSAAVKSVIPAASKKDANQALHGLLLDPDHHEGRLNVVATDRYRVAVFEAEFTSKVDMGTCIIPPWVAERFRKSITSDDPMVSIGWNDNLCTMKSGHFTLTTRQIAGEFVKWRKFFTEGGHDVQVHTESLLAAVRRAQLTTDTDDPVELRFIQQELFVEAGYTNKSTEVLETYNYNKEFAALFGFQYLIDGLTGCDEHDVLFGFTESLKPVSLSSGRFQYIILPRRRT